MPYFTVEIERQPILVFHAETKEAAHAFMGDERLLSDLTVLLSGAGPLWDGQSDLDLRKANASEIQRWKGSVALAIYDGTLESTRYALDRGWLKYLIPVTDPIAQERRLTGFIAPALRPLA